MLISFRSVLPCFFYIYVIILMPIALLLGLCNVQKLHWAYCCHSSIYISSYTMNTQYSFNQKRLKYAWKAWIAILLCRVEQAMLYKPNYIDDISVWTLLKALVICYIGEYISIIHSITSAIYRIQYIME